MSGETISSGKQNSPDKGWESLKTTKMGEETGEIDVEKINKDINLENERQKEKREKLKNDVTWESMRKEKEKEIFDVLQNSVDKMVNDAREKGEESVNLMTEVYKDLGIREFREEVSILNGSTYRGGHLPEDLKTLCRVETAIDSIVKENEGFENYVNKSSDELIKDQLAKHIEGELKCKANFNGNGVLTSISLSEKPDDNKPDSKSGNSFFGGLKKFFGRGE